MPEDTFNPPIPRIYIDGKPQSQFEAEQSGGLFVTRTQGEGLCKRIVAHGHSLQWEGATHFAGAVVHLTPERANELGRKRIVVHPADYQPQHDKPVTVTEDRQHPATRAQGPTYGSR